MSVRHADGHGEGERGISLVELLIVAAISVMVTALAGAALFQFNELTRLQGDALSLDHQLQRAGALLGRDLVAAAEVAVAGSAMTLTLPVHTFGEAQNPVDQTVTYVEVDDALVRTDQQGSMVVARYLDSADFALGPTLRVTVTVSLHQESRTATWAFGPRPSD